MNDVGLEQRLISRINDPSFEESHHLDESFEYKAIFLNKIQPDASNARFLPAKIMDDGHADLFVKRVISKQQLVKMYDSEDYVLLGKKCAINCLKYGSSEWKNANDVIESILDLANNLAVSEIIQVPTIYPVGNGMYQILTGHRRYFALVYTKGYNSVSQFKIYATPPLLKKVKQFQENASREDLPQYGKLNSFLSAHNELDVVTAARAKMGKSRLTVREKVAILGISMGAYDNYRVLTRYPSVCTAYEQGVPLPFVQVKKLVLSIEADYKAETEKDKLNANDKRAINQRIKSALNGDKVKSTAKSLSYKIKPLRSANALRRLLNSNVFEECTEVDWDGLDWEDGKAIRNALDQVVEYFEKQSDADELAETA